MSMGRAAITLTVLALALVSTALARASAAVAGPAFKKVFVIVLENTSAEKAHRQPYLKSLRQRGASLDRFYAVAHPSLPNYIAMTSGSTHGVAGNRAVNLDVRHLGDLLEAKKRTWRQYAGGYPGGCFLGERHDRYVRKHAPFLSYTNVQRDPARCANTVDAARLDEDIAEGRLADYSLYIPDVYDDGHHTGVAYADKWLQKTFDRKFNDARFMKDMLVIVTFDEDDNKHGNHIYTVLLGDSVIAGARSGTRYDFYSLLRTIEDAFALGNLGQKDALAKPVSGVWK